MSIEWKSVRMAYELGGVSIEELTKINRCKESTLSRRARKEGWKKCSVKKEVKKSDEVGSGEPVTPDLIINEHRVLWLGLRELLLSSVVECRGRDGIEGIKEKKALADLLMVVVKGERLAWGLDDTPAEVGKDEEEDTLREMERVTLSPGAGKVMERE